MPPLLQIDAKTFGSGGSNIAPNGSTGKPTLGEVIAAQREDSFFARFDWSTITQAAASDNATLVALVNAIVTQLYVTAPVGARGFGVRQLTPADDADGILAFMISQVNAIKAALIATAAADYTALASTPDADDLATAITLANAIRTTLGLS